MNAAEYRAAAERLLAKDRDRYQAITPYDFRKAEILAQLAVSAATSEDTETRTAPQPTDA
ncbi:hypothetical protein J7F02_13935 [Streptomyces sp. ISL-112]|uniref:hypothetical protein n=1 Tax=unclassified Streptomyces TaxID=2593676 RepID=UPI001BE81B9E|nr:MULTISPECIES: hypothetical protein [unclassified Streptomyces]MBT2426744.1 hypothetical protein [Streptomyces sp. ISL-112]MBT2463321.1 hypothetical protein [Streptomyces sp. ISL-63]